MSLGGYTPGDRKNPHRRRWKAGIMMPAFFGFGVERCQCATVPGLSVSPSFYLELPTLFFASPLDLYELVWCRPGTVVASCLTHSTHSFFLALPYFLHGMEHTNWRTVTRVRGSYWVCGLGDFSWGEESISSFPWEGNVHTAIDLIAGVFKQRSRCCSSMMAFYSSDKTGSCEMRVLSLDIPRASLMRSIMAMALPRRVEQGVHGLQDR